MEQNRKSVVGIIFVEGCVLLLRRSATDRSFPGMWCFPGGRVEAGEDSLAALVREVKEETGLQPPRHLWDPLMLDTTTVDAQGRQYDIDAYILDWAHVPTAKGPFEVLSDEHDASTWTPPLHILDHPDDYPVGPATRIFLEMVTERVLSFRLAKRLVAWGINFEAVRLAAIRMSHDERLALRLGVQATAGMAGRQRAKLRTQIESCIKDWGDLPETRTLVADITLPGQEDSRTQGGYWVHREDVSHDA